MNVAWYAVITYITWFLPALDLPVNQFPLHDDDRSSVLIAGGIGITPNKAMAHSLKARGKSFELHYSGRTAADMGYRERLAIAFPTVAPVLHA